MFIWVTTYETGIEELDSIHKKIIETASGIFDSGMLVKDSLILEKILDKLLFYGNKHEKIENQLMEYYGFPGDCNSEFKRFKITLKAFKQDISEKILDCISISLLLFLKNWIIRHLTIHTQHFKSYKVSVAKVQLDN